MAKKLKVDKQFTPCTEDADDELFPNGLFVFNITKMIKYVEEYPDEFTQEEIEVESINTFSSIEDSKLETIEIGKPVILAEIAPGKYNLIDGHHRMAKARKKEIKTMLAYRLKVDQHIKFLTSHKAYLTYIEYWNDKIR